MPTFEYTARNAQNQLLKGTVDAKDKDDEDATENDNDDEDADDVDAEDQNDSDDEDENDDDNERSSAKRTEGNLLVVFFNNLFGNNTTQTVTTNTTATTTTAAGDAKTLADNAVAAMKLVFDTAKADLANLTTNATPRPARSSEHPDKKSDNKGKGHSDDREDDDD